MKARLAFKPLFSKVEIYEVYKVYKVYEIYEIYKGKGKVTTHSFVISRKREIFSMVDNGTSISDLRFSSHHFSK